MDNCVSLDIDVLNGDAFNQLTITTKWVYVVMAKLQHENNGKTLILTNDELAEKSGISLPTLKRSKKELSKVMSVWLIKETDGNKLSNYRKSAFNINKNTPKDKTVDLNKNTVTFKRKEKHKAIRDGYVYFLKNNDGKIKIGLSINLSSRMGEYTKMSELPEVLHVLRSNNVAKTETLFHELFRNKRVRGEWFNLTNDDIMFIKSNSYSEKIMDTLIK